MSTVQNLAIPFKVIQPNKIKDDDAILRHGPKQIAHPRKKRLGELMVSYNEKNTNIKRKRINNEEIAHLDPQSAPVSLCNQNTTVNDTINEQAVTDTFDIASALLRLSGIPISKEKI